MGKQFRFRTTLLTVLLLAVQWVVAQTLNVRGTVHDANGNPIIGATVAVKGTKTGTVTDGEGKFSLNGMKASDRLVISYIGMEKKEVKVSGNMRIVLADDSNQLDEVMVVAFGKQKRSSFTGSAAVVGMKELEKKQVTNALSAINGEVAGVQMVDNSGDPSTAPTIRIRGFSSINASNNPLIVLDGAPYDGSMNDINPSDIASITVQKDAASNALYGARGANGVIMITTKSAAKGESKTTITLDAKWGANSNAAVDYDVITNPAQYYEMYYSAVNRYYLNSGYSFYKAHTAANEKIYSNTDGGLGYVVYTVPQGEYLIGTNGKLNPKALASGLGYKYTNANTGKTYTLIPDDWEKEALRIALRQEYNISVSSSMKDAQLYASLGYLDNDGIAYNSDYQRYTARLKADWQATRWLSLGGNANFSHSVQNSITTDGSGLFYAIKSMAPIYPLYVRDESGNIVTDSNGKMYDYGNGDVIGLSRTVMTNYNPLQEGALDTNETTANNLTLYGYADITPIEGLKLTFNGTINSNQKRNTSSYNPYYGAYADSYTGGGISKTQSQTYSLNFQQYANYTKSFGRHNMTLLLGHESYKYRYDYLYGMRQNMANYFGNQNLHGAITVVSNGADDYDPNNRKTDYNNEGYFFRGQYDYDGKYFGSVGFRRDASSRFHPDHRWGSFYSLGGAWIISKENWFVAPWVDQLKLKASFGQQGNDNIGEFRYTDLYTVQNSGGEVGLTFYQKGNENITWETNTNLNIGLEFSLWKGRLRGGIEYFYRHTTDMLSWVTAAYEAGYSGSYYNVGSMDNNGVELELNGTVLKTKNLTWNLNFNATHYKNEVKSLASEVKTTTVNGHGGYSNSNAFIGEGLPINSWYMPEYAGVDATTGHALWYKNDGTTTSDYASADKTICGDAIPDLYGGFGTTLEAYGFDFSINFNYSLGGKMYDYMYVNLMYNPTASYAGYAYHKDLLNAWTETNTQTDVPRFLYAEDNTQEMSSRFLTSASYLSLQNINIGYTLPDKWVRKLGLSKVRIYGTAANLCYWSSRKGFDPRGQIAIDDYDKSSTSYYAYSPVRSISGGINIQF